MNILEEKLKQYKAKSDNTSIYQHNQNLLNILQQFKNIFNLSDNLYKQLNKICKLHDIGKIHSDFQNNIKSKRRKVRHEILSASYKKLSNEERLAILLHHKNSEKIKHKVLLESRKYYKDFLEEFTNELDIDTINITDFVKQNFKYNKINTTKNLIYLKGYLQLCDHLASAGVKNIDIGLNTYNVFKLEEGWKYTSIQNKVQNLKNKQDIIIQAMTGLGKTSTAMYWSDLLQNKDKSKRIYYILPYTASINAMYHDFKNKKISTAMLHSKAQYFLNKDMEKEENNDNYDLRQQYQLFKKSTKQVTVCTIYQLFKAIFSCKNFEMLLCQMKNSIFIIDEIHCFEIEQLALILTILKYLKDNFNISICIMSASIPSCLLKLIQKELNINTVIKANKSDLITRHKIYYYKDRLINNIDKIEKDLKNNKQVLICVNSVELSQQLYNQFKDKYSIKLIHGKFNTRDREEAEKDLDKQQLLIGTQAIEVSLDISYDVLYTENAPFDSLLQRFGRINRKGEKDISNIYIFQDSSNIYDNELIKNTCNVLQEIINKDNRIIYEDKVNYYLDKVYDKINIKEYNDRKEKIQEIISTLQVGTYNNNSDMLENAGCKVLPICLLNEYLEYIDNKDYLNASSLLVNISNKQYWYLKSNDLLNDEREDCDIIYLKYNKKVGLLREKDIESQFI